MDYSEYANLSESERQHMDDVLLASARSAQRDAYLRTLGHADGREFAKHCQRLHIQHQYSKRYGVWLRKHLGL